MNNPTINQIIGAIESIAPNSLQESWDNTGLVIGDDSAECTGVMLCVDVTPSIINQAVEQGCNLIISHHPLIFRGIKRINGTGRVEQSVILAIRNSVSIYCCHTSIDKAASQGVSMRMARMLGLDDVAVLSPDNSHPDTGLGAIGNFAVPISPEALVDRVKEEFGSPTVRCTVMPDAPIKRMAMCGGSGSEFIADAIVAGADAYLTSDTRYHDFSDYEGRIFLMDIGHFESEQCTKQIFSEIIQEKFPKFANCNLAHEHNPISYL